MSKNNLNIMVFDDNQSFVTEQSRVNYSTNRRPTAYQGFTNSQANSVVNLEINQLNQKIIELQQKAAKIQQILKNNQNKNFSQTDITSSVNNTSNNFAQVQQLVRTVQVKIQVIVQETKKIIQKITNQFDKKISKYTSQKNHQLNSISKIQAHCRDTIAKVQKHYEQQLNEVRNDHINLEKRLIQKVQDLENSYRRKLKDFQNKEQQYVATIQHLQNKIKLTQKSKKLIQVTQQRPTSSIKTETADNMSVQSSQQYASTNGLPANDTSTSKRRTKIFEGRGSNKSISPNNTNNKVLSPIKAQNDIKDENKYKTKNNNPQGMKMMRPAQSAPLSNNYVLSDQRVGQLYQPVQSIASNQNKPIVRFTTNNNSSAGMGTNVKYQNSEIRKIAPDNNTSRQFIKDAPKVHWERFQDFNQNQDSGDQQDVFFYAGNHQKPQPRSVFDNSHSQGESMHSPFDIK